MNRSCYTSGSLNRHRKLAVSGSGVVLNSEVVEGSIPEEYGFGGRKTI